MMDSAALRGPTNVVPTLVQTVSSSMYSLAPFTWCTSIIWGPNARNLPTHTSDQPYKLPMQDSLRIKPILLPISHCHLMVPTQGLAVKPVFQRSIGCSNPIVMPCLAYPRARVLRPMLVFLCYTPIVMAYKFYSGSEQVNNCTSRASWTSSCKVTNRRRDDSL